MESVNLVKVIRFEGGHSVESRVFTHVPEGFVLAPDWFEIGQDVVIDEAGVISLAPEPEGESVEDVRKRMLADVNVRCEVMLGALKVDYPAGEVLSWDQQVIEARKLDGDANAVTPLLTAIADQRGIDVATLASRVLEKATAYAVASGSIIGARQKLEDAITAATTVDELSAIDVHAGWPA